MMVFIMAFNVSAHAKLRRCLLDKFNAYRFT